MAVLLNPITPTFSVPTVNETAAANSPAASTSTAPTANGATTVQLSGTGRLLSAASIFQGQLAAMHPGTASSATTTHLGTDFASLAAEAQNFVDAFNQAEVSVAGLQGSSDASQFLQALNNKVTTTFANGDTGVNTLAELGITQRPDGRLGLDLASLQAQFNANPTATFSLLNQAVQAFGTLAAGVQTGTGNGIPTSLMNDLGQIIAFQASLSLFATGGGNSTPLGLATLLALQPVNQAGGTGNNLGQQIAALSQFALVSALLV